MATFSNRPPSDPRGNALDIVRTPTSGRIKACITSEDLIGTYTHFWKGRTLPHDHDACQACKNGLPFRWHAWVSAYTAQEHNHVLFECTAQASQAFVAYREAHGTLRGGVFDAWRPSRRPNGRVVIQIKPTDLTGITLPTAPDLVKCLAIIWNIALPFIDAGAILKGTPSVAVSDRPAAASIASNSNGRTT